MVIENIKRKVIRSRARHRKGNILVLSALMIVIMFGFIALSVDMGYAYTQRAELQRCADAAAFAAVADLQEQRIMNPLAEQSDSAAVASALNIASYNKVGSHVPYLPVEHVEVGLLSDLADPASAIIAGSGFSNTARVRITKNSTLNGETRFFFAPVLGHQGVAQNTSSTATASYVSSFKGFAATDGKLNCLPFALDMESWQLLQAAPSAESSDDWAWDPETEQITPGSDGVYEVNLYPQATGSPGNRGTVDIGHSGNSTNDIKRQILDGISESDLAHHGGKLEFDENGVLILNGDTGISAAVKAQLTTIKGQPRMIPVFEDVSGNGNNANYTITKFVGIRIMDVKLTGKMSNKRVIVQPAVVTVRGGIPSTGPEPTSDFIYSPVSLIR